jgi:hypothetical protein
VTCAASLAGCGGSSDGGQATTMVAVPRLSRGSFDADEAASAAHLSRGDCGAIHALVERQVGRRLGVEPEPTPSLSRCHLSGRGIDVNVYLDAAYGARQRYLNRMVEQVQFNAPHADRIPHAVAGVCDRAAGEHYASWIPAYSTLFAVRGNRWVTVAYSVASTPRSRRQGPAAAVARHTFRLTAR